MAKNMNINNKKGKNNKDANSEYVEISRRERYLREKLLTIDEDIIHDERRARRNGERRRNVLTNKINRARLRQEAKLNRQDSSKLYRHSHVLYVIVSPFFAIGRGVRWIYRKLSGRLERHRQVIPHRSFYLTTHAKSVRQINISGYGRFVHEVGRMIWDNKLLYLKALLALVFLLTIVVGLGSRSSYIEVRDALQEVELGWFLEWIGMMTQAIITSMTITDANRQVLALVITLITWMVLIYIARHIYSGQNKLKLRDAIYNSSAPLISMLIMIAIISLQLLPLSIAMLVYSSVTGAGYINQGIEIENMAAWCALAVIAVLTVYWMITSLLSLITVTIPGIYPLRAYFETSIMVSGRRVKILLRLLTMLLPLVVIWLIVLTPIVLLDARFKFDNFPLVQLTTTILVAGSLIWCSAYLYMLYRRIIDSPEQPIGTPNGSFVFPWNRKKQLQAVSNEIDNGNGSDDNGAIDNAKRE